jgi:hypothetical protein
MVYAIISRCQKAEASGGREKNANWTNTIGDPELDPQQAASTTTASMVEERLA